ncbi:MAG: hypothetical protein ACXVMS_06320 [Flavisolibacter sp.]
MDQNRMDPQPRNGAEVEKNEETFLSDTQKIVRRHLENEHDVITEEDIRNVRVGMTPPLDAPTEAAVREREEDEKLADKKNLEEDQALPGSQEITPWDLMSPDE